jgi:hypothetical protein
MDDAGARGLSSFFFKEPNALNDDGTALRQQQV